MVEKKMISVGTGGDGVIYVCVHISRPCCVILNIIPVFTLHLLITASRYCLSDH